MSRATALNALIRQPAAAIARLWQDHQENRHLRLSLDRLQQTSAHLLDDIGMSVVGGKVAINTDEIDIPGAKVSRPMFSQSDSPLQPRSGLAVAMVTNQVHGKWPDVGTVGLSQTDR